MGLDLIEMVYRIEEEFEITIPDEFATTLTTPKMVIDYLMSLPKVNEKWSRDCIHISVWQIIEEEGGIEQKDFNDDSRFVEDMRMG
jgi:hypothetical protein